MRLHPRRHKAIRSSIDAAVRAREDANDQLTKASDMIAVQRERARAEQVSIIAALKKMRETNNLARLILDTVERDVTDAPDQS
jgi:predicted metal-dependent hydrolase